MRMNIVPIDLAKYRHIHGNKGGINQISAAHSVSYVCPVLHDNYQKLTPEIVVVVPRFVVGSELQ